MAGELMTIVTTDEEHEKWGRIELLQRIALWKLHANVSWQQVRNTYAHIIQKIENCEVSWLVDWDRFERHIYNKIAPVGAVQKSDKTKKLAGAPSPNEGVWFRKLYQKPEGGPRDNPHLGTVKGVNRLLQHICANCWLNGRTKCSHPECSPECHQKEQ